VLSSEDTEQRESDMARQRSDERNQFLTDVLTTAVEGGINYWAAVSGYQWDVPLGQAHVDVWETEETDDDYGTHWPDTYFPHRVTVDTIAKGIGILVAERKGHSPASYWHQFVLANRTNGEEGDYDAGIADDILQAGIFGKVVYG
jgi:hypothetical protein